MMICREKPDAGSRISPCHTYLKHWLSGITGGNVPDGCLRYCHDNGVYYFPLSCFSRFKQLLPMPGDTGLNRAETYACRSDPAEPFDLTGRSLLFVIHNISDIVPVEPHINFEVMNTSILRFAAPAREPVNLVCVMELYTIASEM